LAIMPPQVDQKTTTRERFAQHAKDPQCAGCHALLDGIGVAFEGFDGVGRPRTTENGKPIDTSGTLVGSDVDGAFKGPVELGRRLAASGQVRSCFATQWFRYAFGRPETPADRCSIGTTAAALATGDVRSVLLALAQSDAMLLARTGGAR
jgi:hypothetical protein